LNAGQTQIPDDLAAMVDYHVWPSASAWEISTMARTVCDHIDYAVVAAKYPDLFRRRRQYGAPEPAVLWQARDRLAPLGYRLSLDVQFEAVNGLSLVVYGAGVVGRLTDDAWAQVAGLLTSDWTTIVEPAPDVGDTVVLPRPARPSTSRGRRRLPVPVRPIAWEIGDWLHTWWSYPLMGPPSGTANTPVFGPGTHSIG
jgi:hypothetical protein